MNAHQRRKDSRRRHMLLPVGAALDPTCLRSRLVYVLGKYQREMFIPKSWVGFSVKIDRHIYPHGVTVEGTLPEGEVVTFNTTIAGLLLLNPADRKPRPWWSELRRRNLKERK